MTSNANDAPSETTTPDPNLDIPKNIEGVKPLEFEAGFLNSQSILVSKGPLSPERPPTNAERQCGSDLCFCEVRAALSNPESIRGPPFAHTLHGFLLQ